MVAPGLIAVFVGSAAMLVGLAVVSGIVINVVNDGELHKEQMMASPPPPPPDGRRLFEEAQPFDEPPRTTYKLNAKEHATLATFARRGLKR